MDKRIRRQRLAAGTLKLNQLKGSLGATDPHPVRIGQQGSGNFVTRMINGLGRKNPYLDIIDRECCSGPWDKCANPICQFLRAAVEIKVTVGLLDNTTVRHPGGILFGELNRFIRDAR